MTEHGKGRVFFRDSIYFSSASPPPEPGHEVSLPLCHSSLQVGGLWYHLRALEALAPLSLPHACSLRHFCRIFFLESSEDRSGLTARTATPTTPATHSPALCDCPPPSHVPSLIPSTSHPLIQVLLLDLRAFSHYLSGLLALAYLCLSPNTPL